MENKKTTALNASVGADAGQPSKKDNMEMIAQNDLENNLTDEKMQKERTPWRTYPSFY